MNLSNEEKQLIVDCLIIRMDYIKGEGGFQQFTNKRVTNVGYGSTERVPVIKELSEDQIILYAELAKLRDKLNDPNK